MTPDERALLHAQERHDAALSECQTCSGLGECRNCDGIGYVHGHTTHGTCDRCSGSGECVECQGSGAA